MSNAKAKAIKKLAETDSEYYDEEDES